MNTAWESRQNVNKSIALKNCYDSGRVSAGPHDDVNSSVCIHYITYLTDLKSESNPLKALLHLSPTKMACVRDDSTAFC